MQCSLWRMAERLLWRMAERPLAECSLWRMAECLLVVAATATLRGSMGAGNALAPELSGFRRGGTGSGALAQPLVQQWGPQPEVQPVARQWRAGCLWHRQWCRLFRNTPMWHMQLGAASGAPVAHAVGRSQWRAGCLLVVRSLCACNIL